MTAACEANDSGETDFAVLVPSVTCRWCGEAGAASASFVAGASDAFVPVTSRWWGLEAASGADYLLGGGGVCAAAHVTEAANTNASNGECRVMCISAYNPEDHKGACSCRLFCSNA